MLGIFFALAVGLQAAQPAWWTAPGGPVSGTANDYEETAQGQLKQFTQKAVLYMDTNLSGGAGTNLDNLVAGWSNYYLTNGYSSTNPAPFDLKYVNQGQLKYIANLVYPVLASNGYMSTNYPAWTQTNSSDFKVANLGELKQIFNFEIAAPQSPTNFVVIAASTNAILNWIDVLNVQTFTVQSSTDSGTTWSTVATIPGGTRTANVTGLLFGTNYTYQVFASNVAGISAPAITAPPIITLTTPAGATLVP